MPPFAAVIWMLFSLVAAAAARPNLILINADDLGVMDVGFNSPRYRTPNIDKLRAAGMMFSDAYAAASNCSPSRACLMSGQYPPRHGVYTVGTSERGRSRDRPLIPTQNTPFLADDHATLPGVLKAAGYRTIHLGKWHLGEDPLRHGFEINIGGGKSGSPYGGYFAPFTGPMAAYNGRYGDGTHSGDVFADQAIRFLREVGEAPFFMNMAYYLVHTPIQAVPGLVERYQAAGKVNAAFASMVEKLDQSIGAILDELAARGLEEKTLVVFTSDNGGLAHLSSQAPFRSGKGSYFEGGIRVPMVMRWPGNIAAGSTSSTPVSGIDLFPTLLEAAAVPVPDGMVLDGVSLMPLWEGSGGIPDRPLFWHFPVYLEAYQGAADGAHDAVFRTRPGSVVRMGGWKLHEYFEDGRLELYDLEADPGEQANLAADHAAKAAELHELLKQWRRETAAPVPDQRNPDYRPGGG